MTLLALFAFAAGWLLGRLERRRHSRGAFLTHVRQVDAVERWE